MKNLKLLTTLCFFILSPIASSQLDTASIQYKGLEQKEAKSIEEVLESSPDSSAALKPFFTDGCTLFIDGPTDAPKLWRHCCVEHDLRYWFGGSKDDRDNADLRLKSCVEKSAGANWAKIIYYGVKTGQLSPIKNKTHWNWGWKEKREYGPLTSEEVSTVKMELSQLTVPEVDMANFLKINFP